MALKGLIEAEDQNPCWWRGKYQLGSCGGRFPPSPRVPPEHSSPPPSISEKGPSCPSPPTCPRAHTSSTPTPRSGHRSHLAIVWPPGHAVPPAFPAPAQNSPPASCCQTEPKTGLQARVHLELLWPKTFYGSPVPTQRNPPSWATPASGPSLSSVCSPYGLHHVAPDPVSFPTLFSLPGCPLSSPPAPHLQGWES